MAGAGATRAGSARAGTAPRTPAGPRRPGWSRVSRADQLLRRRRAAPRSHPASSTGGSGWRPLRPGRRTAAHAATRSRPAPASGSSGPGCLASGLPGSQFPEPQRCPGTPSCRRPDRAGGGRSHDPAIGKQCPAVVKQHHAVAQQALRLPGMICHGPGRPATWRQSIRAPRPMPAFPLSGPPRVTGLGGRLPELVGGELPQHGWMHGVLLAGSIWVNRDRADVPKSGPGRGRRPGSAARAGRPGPRPGRR